MSKVVYINPDLSPEEAKAAFEKRQKRRCDKMKLNMSCSIPVQQTTTVTVEDPNEQPEQPKQPGQSDACLSSHTTDATSQIKSSESQVKCKSSSSAFS